MVKRSTVAWKVLTMLIDVIDQVHWLAVEAKGHDVIVVTDMEGNILTNQFAENKKFKRQIK